MARRTPKADTDVVPICSTPLEHFKATMNNTNLPEELRLRAAISAARYMHSIKGQRGKREEHRDRADEASAGKFAEGSAPKLRAVGK